MNNKKFEIIEANNLGRRHTIRFKQYEYTKPLELTNWTIKDNGCGPTSLATILATFGYDENPISIAKMMLFNEFGFLSDSYYDNINNISIIYCLNKLTTKYKDLSYKIIKINYNKPDLMKDKVIKMIEDGYMAIVNVGPGPNSFCSRGHYIVITSVNKNNKEFYVANSWYDGDNQIDQTFSYEQIVKEIYKDTFDFLMIKKD